MRISVGIDIAKEVHWVTAVSSDLAESAAVEATP